jgi:hypothetical protein
MERRSIGGESGNTIGSSSAPAPFEVLEVAMPMMRSRSGGTCGCWMMKEKVAALRVAGIFYHTGQAALQRLCESERAKATRIMKGMGGRSRTPVRHSPQLL